MGQTLLLNLKVILRPPWGPNVSYTLSFASSKPDKPDLPEKKSAEAGQGDGQSDGQCGLFEFPRERKCSTDCFRRVITRRPASADRTARRKFQATGQPVSRRQASDTMTSRLPRCAAKSVQRRCFQCGSRSLCVQISREQSYPLPIS